MSSSKKKVVFGGHAEVDLFAEAKSEVEEIKVRKMMPIQEAAKKLQEADKLFDLTE